MKKLSSTEVKFCQLTQASAFLRKAYNAALENALRREDVETISRLIKDDPHLLKQKTMGQDTLLAHAVVLGSVPVVSLLLDLSADPNLTHTLDYPVILSSGLSNANKSWEITDLLLSAGANPDVASEFGQTPTHAATVAGNLRTLDYLLSHGAKVNEVDKAGNTPLHFAVSKTKRNRTPIIQSLLAKGADPSIANNTGLTGFALAERKGDRKTLRLMEDWSK